MRPGGGAGRAGMASLEACLVTALLVAAILAGSPGLSRSFLAALDRALLDATAAIGADLP